MSDLTASEIDAARCFDCLKLSIDSPQALIDRETWLQISPYPDGGGKLCLVCANERMGKKNIRAKAFWLYGLFSFRYCTKHSGDDDSVFYGDQRASYGDQP